ncbi:Fur family transcriptional regulator [Thermosediminibacter oceani]|uniref:Ferric uptake regulator, Fur family n=1 Tax=Thermosediminibacter oceani (strain ATCC BAA-1034 / DSM 16646 / JW/IW-1228P) TaxID=555079 RepID=D9S0J0_THEOJ|nr:transcriptional repressor [Thermosediminibacter oceani]ADL08848.1 ferric uptake regulator, Fur family [Thermosediminibacter oceani DSM 16646]
MDEKEKKGFVRNTRQRALILEVLRSTRVHPTADWIYEKVKKKIPNISLGTVYRNLATLKKMGEIMELNYGSKNSRYDGKPENHYHFVCLECGQTFDVEDLPVNRELDKEVADRNGWEVFYHRLEFYGLCGDCGKKED